MKEDVFTSVHYKDLSFSIPPHKVLLSLEEDKFKPLPDEYDTIKAGEPYAIMKSLTSDDLYSVFSENLVLEAEQRYIIPEVKLYANSWNEDIPEYKEWVEKAIYDLGSYKSKQEY